MTLKQHTIRVQAFAPGALECVGQARLALIRDLGRFISLNRLTVLERTTYFAEALLPPGFVAARNIVKRVASVGNTQ